MTYRKRYEDSYLDKDEEEIPGDDRTDGEKLVELIEQSNGTEEYTERIKARTERLFMNARMPSTPGAVAIMDIALVAESYASRGDVATAVDLWTRVLGIAEVNGDKELYFRSMEEITNLG